MNVTLSPFLAACKSVGGFGNSSDGASGGPIDAHPLSAISIPAASSNFPNESFMQKQRLHQEPSSKDFNGRRNHLSRSDRPKIARHFSGGKPSKKIQRPGGTPEMYRKSKSCEDAPLTNPISDPCPTPPTPSPHREKLSYANPHHPSPSAETSAPYCETASTKSRDSSHTNA